MFGYATPEGRGEGEVGSGKGVSGFALIWGQILNAHISKMVRDNPIVIYDTRFRVTRGRSIDCAWFQSSRTMYKRYRVSWSEFGAWTTERIGNDGFPYQRTCGEVSNPKFKNKHNSDRIVGQ